MNGSETKQHPTDQQCRYCDKWFSHTGIANHERYCSKNPHKGFRTKEDFEKTQDYVKKQEQKENDKTNSPISQTNETEKTKKGNNETNQKRNNSDNNSTIDKETTVMSENDSDIESESDNVNNVVCPDCGANNVGTTSVVTTGMYIARIQDRGMSLSQESKGNLNNHTYICLNCNELFN